MIDRLVTFHSKDFNTSASSKWRNIKNEKDFYDVTFACEGSQISVHKVVLSGCSPVLGNLLKNHPHQHPLILLQGIKYRSLLSVIEFMYEGKVNIIQQHLNDFLSLMKDLKVIGDFKINDASFKIDENVDEQASSQANSDKNETNNQQLENKELLNINDVTIKHVHIDDTKDNSRIIEIVDKTEILKEISIAKDEKAERQSDLFQNEVDVEQLENIFENKELLKIKQVDMEHVNMVNLKQNKEIIQSIDSQCNATHSCTYCDMIFTSKQSLEKHIQRKHKKDLNSVDCDICEKSILKYDIKTHIKTVHTKETRHKCALCDFRSFAKQVMMRHMQTRHSDIKYTCSICGFESHDKHTIKNHEAFVHKDERNFMCNICGKTFTGQPRLNKHTRQVHGDIKFPCEICGKEICKEYLQTHLKSHDSNKLLNCTFCDKSFATKQKLKEHTNIHTGEKPYACPASRCGMRFSSSSSLIHHKKKCL